MGLDMYLEKRKKGNTNTNEIMYWRKCQDLNCIIIDETKAESDNCSISNIIITKEIFDTIVLKATEKGLIDLELYTEEIKQIEEEFNNLGEDEEIIYSSDR